MGNLILPLDGREWFVVERLPSQRLHVVDGFAYSLDDAALVLARVVRGVTKRDERTYGVARLAGSTV